MSTSFSQSVDQRRFAEVVSGGVAVRRAALLNAKLGGKLLIFFGRFTRATSPLEPPR